MSTTEIINWILSIQLGTMLYNSLTESHLQMLLLEPEETREDIARYFNKKIFSIGISTFIIEMIPILNQFYAILLSAAVMFLDDKDDDGELMENQTLRQYLYHEMMEEMKNE